MAAEPTIEEVLEPMPFDQLEHNQPVTPFEKVNDEAPSDAEPFVAPEEAPKNDPVEEPE